MPGQTTKGYPFSQGGDAAATIDSTMQSLAEKNDARPGIESLTTAARDALAAADKWAGRKIWNSTLGRHQTYDGAVWTTDVTQAEIDAAATPFATICKYRYLGG